MEKAMQEVVTSAVMPVTPGLIHQVMQKWIRYLNNNWDDPQAWKKTSMEMDVLSDDVEEMRMLFVKRSLQ